MTTSFITRAKRNLSAKKARKNAGYSLLEVVITSALIGTVAAVGAPKLLTAKAVSEANAYNSAAVNFAQQCASANIGEYAFDSTNLPSQVVQTGGCDSSAVTTFEVDHTDADKLAGVKCLFDKSSGTETTCTVSVGTEGSVTGEWS